MHFTGFDSTCTSAMGTNYDRSFQTARMRSQVFTQSIAQTACFNRGNRAVFDIINQKFMAGIQGTRHKRQILDTLSSNSFHDHFDDIVAITEMMMERNCHPILQARFFNGFCQGCQYLISTLLS